MAIEPTGLSTTKLNVNESGTNGKAKSTPEVNEKNQNKPAINNLVDTVTLTASAEKLLALKEKLSDVPEIDSERVNQIRSAIESGNYNIDTAKVADKFLDFEKSLP